MKIITTLILWTLLTLSSAAQIAEEQCGVRFSADHAFDHMDYAEYVQKYKDRPKDNSLTQVPIVARIVRHTDQTGGLDLDLLDGIIDTLNKRYEPVGLEFFQCTEPDFVDVDVFYDFDRSIYRDSLVTYNIPNVINIYFINKVLNDDSFICGYASFPWVEGEYVVVKNSCALNGSTVAHEIGHYLGLYHTHETSNGNEPANGQFCAITGDLMCDTPADPRLNGRNVDTDCSYTGDARDNNGDAYAPDPTNMMSYAPKKCRTTFSDEQIMRMQYYLDRDRSHLGCLSTSTDDIGIDTDIDVMLYPNPFREHMTLWINRGKGRAQAPTLTFIDIAGRAHEAQRSSDGDGQYHSIDTADIPRGLYILRIRTGDQVIIRQVLKQ